jgi:hypothetical protein
MSTSTSPARVARPSVVASMLKPVGSVHCARIPAPRIAICGDEPPPCTTTDARAPALTEPRRIAGSSKSSTRDELTSGGRWPSGVETWNATGPSAPREASHTPGSPSSKVSV